MRIETSSMLIGSSARTTFGSTASARAIATLCRWPPESSCGYLAAMSSGGTSPTVRSSSCTRCSTWREGTMLVDPKRTLDVVAHRLHRIERAEGVLEDDLDLRAVVKDVAPPPDVRDVAPLEQDLPALGSYRCASRRATVLFPLPLSPTSAVIVPGRSSNDTSSTAWTCDRRTPLPSGKRFVRLRTSSGAAAVIPRPPRRDGTRLRGPPRPSRSLGRSVVCRR